MRNYGNTCYFNSALQCLKKIRDINEDHWELLCRFRTRFSQFTPGQPHDAQEALVCLIDLLGVTEVEGKMLQEVVCKTGTVKTEVLTTVLSVTAVAETLGECLTRSQSWTTVLGYTDTGGTTHNVAAIRTTFHRVPKFLVLSLNQKTFITVSELLNINKTYEYQLVASCVHMGSEHGGHYIALVKEDSEWVLKDDEASFKLESFPCRHTHYILVYKLLNSLG